MIYFDSLHMDLLLICDKCKNYVPVHKAIHKVIEFSVPSDEAGEHIHHVLCRSCYNSEVMKIPVEGDENDEVKG